MVKIFRAWLFAVVVLLPATAWPVDITVTATLAPNAYYFNGGATANPTLTLTRGETYTFILDDTVVFHPFRIQSANVYAGAFYPTGVTNNGANTGTVTFVVPNDAPDTLYYYCGAHPGMVGVLNIVNAASAAASDFDGDGRSDILWRNYSSGDNYLYPMNGTAIGAGEGPLRTVAPQTWKIAGVGDFNGDGKADILWRNHTTGENYVYLMNGRAITGEGYIRQVSDLSWFVAGVADFDGDGKADILWRNISTGENYLYPMDGLTILGGEGYLRQVASHLWSVAGLGDFNGDGKSDILWRNTSTGENYIYMMSSRTIMAEGYIRGVPEQSWQVAGVGDFDGDGKADILWRNHTSGENYLYPMSSTTIMAGEGYLRSVTDRRWVVAATGDYDGDGKTDILWRHVSDIANTGTGENYIYPMDGRTIKPSEGYIRTVAPQAWQPQGNSFFAVKRGTLDPAQVGTPPPDSTASGTTNARMNFATREVIGRADTTPMPNATLAHIHIGARTVSGGVIVNYTSPSANVWVADHGAKMPVGNYVSYINGNTYVNIHTNPGYPGGEIRGQLE